MAHSQETRDAVRAAYVYDRLSLKDAAKKVGVGYQAALIWKQRAAKHGDNWERARAAVRLASGGLGDVTLEVVEEFVLMFKATMDGVKQSKDITPLQKAEVMSRISDAYVKMMKAATGGNPKMGKLAIALEVINEFTDWVRKNRPELTEPISEIIEPFGRHISQVMGE